MRPDVQTSGVRPSKRAGAVRAKAFGRREFGEDLKPAANRAPIFTTRAEALRFLAANAIALVGLACMGTAGIIQRLPPQLVAYILWIAGSLMVVVPVIYLHFFFVAVAKRLQLPRGTTHWLSRNPATWGEAFKTAKREPQQ